jgi:CCR4-NOT transcriptional complex subunit CAF120
MTAERNQNASWGNPNNGSASPAQYQQARQSPGVGTSPQQAQSQMAPSPPQPQPQQVRPARSHTRSSSFFSFRKSNSEKQLPQRAFSTVQQRSSPTGANNFDEYGRLQPSVPNKLRHSPPTNTASQQGRPMLETATQGPIMPVPQPLHPEIRSMIQLNLAHAHKIYFSGPLVRRIERQADGQRPAKDEGWTDVWGQLGGTTLSIWDMKQIEEASKQGKEVPPTYVNITDAVRIIDSPSGSPSLIFMR